MSSRRRRIVVRGLVLAALVLIFLIGYLSVAVIKEGGPGNLLDWEEIDVATPPDGTEDEIGDGWEVVFTISVDNLSGRDEAVDPPRSPLYAYMHCNVVVLRRRRFQAYLPLHLLGIR